MVTYTISKSRFEVGGNSGTLRWNTPDPPPHRGPFERQFDQRCREAADTEIVARRESENVCSFDEDRQQLQRTGLYQHIGRAQPLQHSIDPWREATERSGNIHL
jgi:hypothetical protein